MWALESWVGKCVNTMWHTHVHSPFVSLQLTTFLSMAKRFSWAKSIVSSRAKIHFFGEDGGISAFALAQSWHFSTQFSTFLRLACVLIFLLYWWAWAIIIFISCCAKNSESLCWIYALPSNTPAIETIPHPSCVVSINLFFSHHHHISKWGTRAIELHFPNL